MLSKSSYLESMFRQNLESFGYQQVTDHDNTVYHEIITDSGYITDEKQKTLEDIGVIVEYRKRPLSERMIGMNKQVVFRFEDDNDFEVLAKKYNAIMNILGIRLPSNEFENIEDICRRPVIAGIRIGQPTVLLNTLGSELKQTLGFNKLEEHISSLRQPTM